MYALHILSVKDFVFCPILRITLDHPKGLQIFLTVYYRFFTSSLNFQRGNIKANKI